MESDPFNPQALMAAVDALQREVAELRQRLAACEQVLPPSAHRAKEPSAGAPADEPLSEELIATISAAIAAYLGVKPHIRQIRLLRSEAWAQHGRVTVQASHALTRQHS